MLGALGPTTRTLSLSPDVNDPSFRAVTFEAVRDAYAEQARGLIDGGVDVLLVETIFDTLNAKAALIAIEAVCREKGVELPVLISVTITDQSGRTLSGQTVEAFWTSIAHAQPLCGRHQLRARRRGDAALRRGAVAASPTPSSAATRTPGLPNAFGGYDESPDEMAQLLREFAAAGWSTSSAAAAAPRPTTSARSPKRCAACRRARFPAIARAPALRGPRGARDPPRVELHDGRRAHQRHRLEALREADPRRATTTRRSRSRSTRCAAARTSSTSTWTRGCSTPSARWRSS